MPIKSLACNTQVGLARATAEVVEENMEKSVQYLQMETNPTRAHWGITGYSQAEEKGLNQSFPCSTCQF